MTGGYRYVLLIALAPWLLISCASHPEPNAGPTFLLVRHAEKAADGSKDPALSPAGQARAQRIGAALRDVDLRAVYATRYRRTQQTAHTVAAAIRQTLPVLAYDADQPAAQFAARLRDTHASGTVLVVGHSNTVPAIAAALCGCVASPLGDGDYGRVYRVEFDARGRSVLTESVQP